MSDLQKLFLEFLLVIKITWKKKLTHQWIRLFMENLMVQISSW